MKNLRNCLGGLLELLGLFIALSWPILLLFLHAHDVAGK